MQYIGGLFAVGGFSFFGGNDFDGGGNTNNMEVNHHITGTAHPGGRAVIVRRENYPGLP